MNHSFLFVSMLVCAVSCQKQGKQLETALAKASDTLNVSNVQKFMKDSLPPDLYDSLDYSGKIVTTNDTGRTFFIRFPTRGVPIAKRFILVQIDRLGNLLKGAGFVINQTNALSTAARTVTASGYTYSFNGTITKTWLNGSVEYSSMVTGGFIRALHAISPVTADEAAVSGDFDGTGEELPDILITADDDEEYYYSLDGLLDDEEGGSIYTSSGGRNSGGGSGASSTTITTTTETQDSRPGITLKGYMHCFTTIPDEGASYSVTLMVCIPVSNPNIMFNAATKHVGHTFLQLVKSNNGKSIIQYIGFYASCGICAVSGDPTASKLVDNSGHPYNASYTVNLSAAQFDTVQNSMASYAMNDYALCNYNCTNWAVDVVNSVLPDPLTMTQMTIPGGTPGETPNGLYITLEKMLWDGSDGVSVYPKQVTAGGGNGSCE